MKFIISYLFFIFLNLKCMQKNENLEFSINAQNKKNDTLIEIKNKKDDSKLNNEQNYQFIDKKIIYEKLDRIEKISCSNALLSSILTLCLIVNFFYLVSTK